MVGKKPKKLTAAQRKSLRRSRTSGEPQCRLHPLGYHYEDEQRTSDRATAFSAMVPSILALYGSTRTLGVERFENTWREIYRDTLPDVFNNDPDGDRLRLVSFRAGTVRIETADNLLLQEAMFVREQVLREFQRRLPEEKITGVRFAVPRG